MFSVGAIDAYFCDAYTDIVAATIISKTRHPAMTLPNFFYEIKFPVRAIIEPDAVNTNWRWRMAARKMMERQNVLSLEQIRKLFNQFFRPTHKFFGEFVLEAWVVDPPRGRKRLFGVARDAYSLLGDADRRAALKEAGNQMDERFRVIFQRRHDCIHNCDRPKTSLQLLQCGGTVFKVIEDVEFLVTRSDAHINAEFRQFLLDNGAPPTVAAQVGY